MTEQPLAPQPAANDEHSTLAQLKGLLLGAEQRDIGQLRSALNDPGEQLRRQAKNLAAALQQAHDNDAASLRDALEPPVSACVEDTIRRNPQGFAEVLYPVIGPAIRRSISQAMHGLLQQITQTLDHSLTLKGLRWRVESLRTGIPFAETVLRHTLRYRVEEVFLIHSNSGMLIHHLGRSDYQGKDADAVSAMLTAIRDFAQDTLSRDGESSRLDTIDLGDHTLWLSYGPHAYLACAIRGVPPVGLRDELDSLIEQVHQRHAPLLKDFNGDPLPTDAVQRQLEPCLRAELHETAQGGRPWPLILLTLTLTAALLWWGKAQWQQAQLHNQRSAQLYAALDLLRDSPGILIAEAQLANDVLDIRGLYDPLLPAPATLAAAAGVDPGALRLRFQPFESSHPDAALARALQRLAPPAGVQLAMSQPGRLLVSGVASTQWQTRAALLATTIPGIDALDTSGLTDSDQLLLRMLNETLLPPPGVSIRIEHAQATLSGEAPVAWIDSLRRSPPDLPGLVGMQIRLTPLEKRRLAQLREQIESTHISFAQGAEPDSLAAPKIEALTAWAAEAQRLAQDIDAPTVLQIIGRTDAVGSTDLNLALAERRARRVATMLFDSGATLPAKQILTQIEPGEASDSDPELRRVEFRLIGTPPTDSDITP